MADEPSELSPVPAPPPPPESAAAEVPAHSVAGAPPVVAAPGVEQPPAFQTSSVYQAPPVDQPPPVYVPPAQPAPPVPEAKPEGPRGGVVAGTILIVLGIVFLGQIWGWFSLGNWWALFIFIPAAFSFGSAWTAYRNHGGFTREMAGPLVGGLVLSLVALMLLFSWDWGLLWPVFLVLAGVGILLGRSKG